APIRWAAAATSSTCTVACAVAMISRSAGDTGPVASALLASSAPSPTNPPAAGSTDALSPALVSAVSAPPVAIVSPPSAGPMAAAATITTAAAAVVHQ